jgi:oxygen-independent coproporphyrinogen-3 oxidase
MPDPDLAAEMYEWASETLEKYGYVQYEISNWARDAKSEVRGRKSEEAPSDLRPLTSNPQNACRHNLQYWRNLPYLGFGAGAHGYVPSALLSGSVGYRYSDVLAPAAYIERIERGGWEPFPFSPAVREKIPVTTEDAMGETMMMGMRLVGEGVSGINFESRFGVTLNEQYGKKLRQLRELKLIEWEGERVRLTRGGRLLGNRVFREFV